MKLLFGLLILLAGLGTTTLEAQTPPVYEGLVVPTDYEERSFYPASVACGPNGWLYVTDPVGHRILAFDGETKQLWDFLDDPNLLPAPLGLDVDRDGRLYVADSSQRRINIFSAAGSLERFLTGTESEPLKGPDAVAVDDSLNVYVADGVRNRILKFDAQGTLVLAWGTTGTKAGELRGPSDLEIAEDGSLFVLETLNSRMQRFAPDGTHLDMWGSDGGSPHQMDSPRGFTIKDQRVLIADTDNYQVKEFDFQGNLILSWGGWKGAPGGVFESLVDLAIGPQGCVLVIDVRRMYLYCYQVPVEQTVWGDIKKRWADPDQ